MKSLSASAKARIPFILMVIAVLILAFGASIIICLCRMTKHVEIESNMSSQRFHSQVKSEVEKTTKLLNHLMSTSTMSTIEALSLSLNGSNPSLFSDIENKIAPFLFQFLSITPHLRQISYIGYEGLLFSYYKDDQDQTFALYSNSSFGSPQNLPKLSYWYTQMVNRTTGELIGNVVPSANFIATNNTNSSWLHEALSLKNVLKSSLGSNWNDKEDVLVINTAQIRGNLGLVSLGFSVEEVAKYYTDINLQGGKSGLFTGGDGKLLAGDSIFSMDLNSIKANVEMLNVSWTMSRSSRTSLTKNDQRKFMFQSTPVNLLGVKLIYALEIQKSGSTNFVHRYKIIILVLLILTVAITIALISFLLPIIHRASIRNMYLSATLIKQMNATEQAERKSMNKTHAFATASHDIRASLAGMIGLIEICYDEVTPGSELETNLRQLEGCTKDLSGMLTSILDTSKIEAGKMLLEEEEFDVAQLFEDVVDLYHPVGAKKGVDVILDPCDGSISKFSLVKCDRVKLRQILSNLISNAVKFTSDGQVVVRAWLKKPTVKNSMIEQSNRYGIGLVRSLISPFFKNKKENETLEVMETAEDDPNSMELVCEVDDTGKGIPKEKRDEVFENYVQVKETALGQGGTGLGLGIVQSLVRLMHGEIGIIDKDLGEQGSCFRFNISLALCENISESSKDIEDYLSPQNNPTFPAQSPSKVEGSCVVLLIENEERRRISEKFMKRLGIRVFALKSASQLPLTLNKIMRKRNRSSSSNMPDSGIENDNLSKSSVSPSRFNVNDPPIIQVDGADYLRSLFRKSTNKNYIRSAALGLVLLIVDTNLGKLPELREAVNEFRYNIVQSACRVVWLANRFILGKRFDDSDDIVKYKPFHGSRLYEVVRLLPEFGGPTPKKKLGSGSTSRLGLVSYNINVPKNSREVYIDSDQIYHAKSDKLSGIMVREVGSSSKEKPLFGKRILVVDDNDVLRKLAMKTVEKLGGKAESCGNGKKAVEVVSNGLSDHHSRHGDSASLPYDYILMDCEMPEMNGYDATREIRKIETTYDFHIPIIALTAHAPGSEEANRTFKAGMDACLTKPLKDTNLIDVLKILDRK